MRSYVSVSIDVTYLCNMKCKHCYNKSNRKDPREMSSEMLLNVARDIARVRTESVCFCGGEPLCRFDDICNMARTIKSIDPSKAISMVTNGLLWKDETGSLLKAAGVDAVQFSLDGFTSESYDYVRDSDGQVDSVFNAISIAKNAGLRIMICTLPHKKSLPEIDDILEFCARNKVEEFRVQPMMPLGRGEESFDELALSQQEYAYLKKKLSGAGSIHPGLKVEWGDPIDHFFMMQEVDGIPNIAINAYGEILLSPYLPITLWDLKKYSLKEYIDKNIAEKALSIPLVQEILSSLVSVSDLTSKQNGMPELFLGKNIDLTDELATMEVAS